MVDAGDVVHPLDAIQVALMHGVDAHKARAPVGAGRFAHADGVADRAGFAETGALHQELHILWHVLAGKGCRRGAVAFGQRHCRLPVVRPARQQPRDLGAAVAAGAAQVGQHNAPVRFAQLRVAKPAQNPVDESVPLAVIGAGRRKHHMRRSCQKSVELRNRAQSSFVHVDHHPGDDQPTQQPQKFPPSGSYFVGNTQTLQAHTSLDKA